MLSHYHQIQLNKKYLTCAFDEKRHKLFSTHSAQRKSKAFSPTINKPLKTILKTLNKLKYYRLKTRKLKICKLVSCP